MSKTEIKKIDAKNSGMIVMPAGQDEVLAEEELEKIVGGKRIIKKESKYRNQPNA